jgi:hypothetical protein
MFFYFLILFNFNFNIFSMNEGPDGKNSGFILKINSDQNAISKINKISPFFHSHRKKELKLCKIYIDENNRNNNNFRLDRFPNSNSKYLSPPKFFESNIYNGENLYNRSVLFNNDKFTKIESEMNIVKIKINKLESSIENKGNKIMDELENKYKKLIIVGGLNFIFMGFIIYLNLNN